MRHYIPARALNFRRALIAVTVLLWPLAAAYSVDIVPGPAAPLVKGEVIRDFARITFEWPRHTYLEASTRGDMLTVRFDRKVELEYGDLMSRLSPYLHSAALSEDGKTLSVEMDKSYKVRSFVSDNINGIDILGIDPMLQGTLPDYSRKTRYAKQEEKKQKIQQAVMTKRIAELAPAAGTPEPNETAAQKSSAEAAPEGQMELAQNTSPPLPTASVDPAPTPAPEAGASQQELELTVDDKPSEEIILDDETVEIPVNVEPPAYLEETSGALDSPESEPIPEDDLAVSAPPTVIVSPADAPTPAIIAVPELNAKPELDTTLELAVDNGEDVKVFASTRANRTILRFAWPERVAAAAFIRGQQLWIIFNQERKLDLSAVQETAAALYPRVKVDKVPGSTVLRLPVALKAGVSVNKKANSHEWSVILLNSPQPPLSTLDVAINTAPPLLPHIMIPAEETSAPIEVTDPLVGDKLILIPSYRPMEGIFPKRAFVDFSLFASAQGIAIEKISDQLTVTPVRNGLRISTENGASLSDDLPIPIQPSEETKALEKGGTLFPYEAMQGRKYLSLTEKILAQQQQIALNMDKATLKNKLVLDFAKLYLAHGLAAEALGQLHNLQRQDPSYFVASRASAYVGAASFLLNRYEEAADAFAAAELQGSREVEYWQTMLSDLLGATVMDYDFLAHQKDYISMYPPHLRQRVAILAADKKIVNEQYNEALQVIETLGDSKLFSDVENYVSYLLARIAVETGEKKKGLDIWQGLAQRYSSPFVRARAEFSLLAHKAENNPAPENLNPLVSRLERLALSWRGDGLEVEVLKFLSELYIQQGELLKALYVWRDIVYAFPNTPVASESLARMRATFVDLFEGEYTETTPPLEQLILYYEFRSLTPPGESGDRLVNHIADKLIALDMLDQAITLMSYRMRYIYEKSGRSTLGSRLANVYLLNKKPEKALAALRDSVYGANNEALATERDRLAARAMVETGQYSEAIDLLKKDGTPEAQEIREYAYWKQKDWDQLINEIEDDLGERTQVTTMVTPRETEKLIRLAIAYRAQEEAQQLQYLRDYFTPLMTDSRNKELFAFITLPDIAVTPETFDMMIEQVESTGQFLDNYRYKSQPQPMGAEPGTEAST